jgi:Carboxypeptidase regulatory-like domain
MKAVAFLLALILGAGCVWGQATSQIEGVVRDESGSAVPGADVKATQTETNVVRATVSSADGTYVLANLPIGPYRLEVAKTGFTTYVQTGIVLQVATNPALDISLKVGSVTEQVQVEANAALVETRNTNVGAVIENRRILELPLNGRNPAELIQLVGAAVPAGINGTAGFPGGLNISVDGGLLSGVNYSLDGALYNNPFDAVNLPFPFPDALQEFKVETNSLTADKGTHAAGAVSAVVKSGTNSYHGDLFEFFRNGELNARNSFAARRDTLKRNQYGGTFGGPIRHNKVFFFVGYEGTRTRSDPADRTGFVPTPAMLAGDFSGCRTFPASIVDPTTGRPFPNKQVDPTRFSPQSLAIVKLLPQATGPCGEVHYGPVQKIDEYQVVGRTDYQISAKQSLFFRYMATTYLLPAAYGFSKNLLDSSTGGLDDLAQTALLGHTYVISPTTVNVFRIGVNRVGVHRFNDDYFSPCDIGVKFYCFVPHQTVVTVTGGPSIGVGTAIEARFIPTYETLSDDVTMVHGSHQIGFGFSGFKYQHSQFANVFSAASFGFGNLPAQLNGGTGVGIVDFLLGRVGTMTQGSPNTTFTNKNYVSLYAEDTWNVSRRFTLSYGLRWEPFLPQAVNNGAVYNFSWDRFKAGIRSTVFKNAPLGLLYAGDPGFEGTTGVEKRFNQFAPRIGIAIDPKGDGKTSIRSSFGISYDFPNIQIMSTPTTAPPFGNALTGIQGPLNFGDPWSTVPGGNPFPGSFGPNATFILNGNYVPMDPHAKATTVYSWNLSLQRQIGASWLVSASYLGTHSIHIWGTEQLNPALIVPCPGGAPINTCNTTGNTNSRRLASLLNPAEGKYLSYIDMFDSGGTGSYHAMLLLAEKRLTRGVSLNANYTWSHCIADINQGSWVGSVGGGLNIADNRSYDRGNCQTQTGTGINQSLDRRHIVNITGVVEAPKFNQRTFRWIASDWKLSSSYRYLSGAFLTVTTGVDYALNGSAAERPNLLLSNPLAVNPAATCGTTAPCQAWLNRDAFSGSVPFGTFGNLGRSSVPGPNTWEIDTALSRVFRVRENQTVEIRGEAFNLTNSYRSCIGCVGGLLGGTSVTVRNSPQFGQITVADAPRIMQLAAKFVF